MKSVSLKLISFVGLKLWVETWNNLLLINNKLLCNVANQFHTELGYVDR